MSSHKSGSTAASFIAEDAYGIMQKTRFDREQVSTGVTPVKRIGVTGTVGAASYLGANPTTFGSDALSPNANVWMNVSGGATWALPTIAQLEARLGVFSEPGDGWKVFWYNSDVSPITVTSSADIVADAAPVTLAANARYMAMFYKVSPTSIKFDWLRIE